MTEQALVDLGLKVHLGVFTLSLAAAYAVFSDRFILPMIQRAEDLCAQSRGKLTTELTVRLKQFVEPLQSPKVADVQLVDDQGRPYESASIRGIPKFDSEEFKNAVGGFLDDESDGFDRYWLAFECKHKLLSVWNFMRVVAGLWPACSVVAVGLFGAWSQGIIPLLPIPWLSIIGVGLLAPLVLFVSCLPRFAHHGGKLDRLRR